MCSIWLGWRALVLTVLPSVVADEAVTLPFWENVTGGMNDYRVKLFQNLRDNELDYTAGSLAFVVTEDKLDNLRGLPGTAVEFGSSFNPKFLKTIWNSVKKPSSDTSPFACIERKNWYELL
eukprot:GHVU01120137.1.p2 GENE.GHVU01120137.1~~GHVU01120137.1.p2  ORF type:complete len:121 (-),score=10.72 GHVU01120137.1:223-585(-)